MRIALDSIEMGAEWLEYIKAFIAHLEKRFYESSRMLEGLIVELESKNDEKLLPEVLLLQCMNYACLKDYDNVIKTCKKGYSIRRCEKKFYINCAAAYLSKAEGLISKGLDPEKDIKEALYLLRIALKIDPDEESVHLNMGTAYGRKAEYLFYVKGNLPFEEIRKAIESFKRATELEPLSSGAWYFLGTTYELKVECLSAAKQDPLEDLQHVIDAFEKAIKLALEENSNKSPAIAFLFNKLALACFLKGSYLERKRTPANKWYLKAIRSWKKAIKLDPRLKTQLRPLIEKTRKRLKYP
jgi:tetratricopeptide (TPR) repeat protein